MNEKLKPSDDALTVAQAIRDGLADLASAIRELAQVQRGEIDLEDNAVQSWQNVPYFPG